MLTLINVHSICIVSLKLNVFLYVYKGTNLINVFFPKMLPSLIEIVPLVPEKKLK